MQNQDPKAMLTAMLQPWHDSIADPTSAQKAVLQRLLRDYAKTGYGQKHNAESVQTIEAYQEAFPIAAYEDFKPMIEGVMAGEVDALLPEEPVGWAITRGTTAGESKFIP
ncbi:MAG: GH3 auxin-responsive promoter family protein, partial [Anaerolineales bacterium]|nr:GH3 auxin-responsive promoter family protein [Anaerolineales bacterium]